MLLLIHNALEARNNRSTKERLNPKKKYKLNYKVDLPPFSTFILEWCWRHNLTQSELAKRLGIDTLHLNDYLFLRRNRFPNGEFLKLIFEKLNLSDEERKQLRKAFVDSRLSQLEEFTHVRTNPTANR